MLKIELNDDCFRINGTAVEFPITHPTLTKLLGKCRHTNGKKGKIFTWDEAGVVARTNDEALRCRLLP